MSQIIASKNVTIRKEHKCFGCGRKKPKGAKMLFQAIADEGSVWNSYLCETCETYLDRHWHYNEEFYDGELPNDEKWEEVRKEIEEETNESRR